MEYEKNFIDRSPNICAAGKPLLDATQSVKECFKDYNLQDEVDALKHDAGIFKEDGISFPESKLKNTRHQGVETEIRGVLRPPVKTRYQTLINDLKETSYESYWNKLEGRTTDPLSGLPKGMVPVETTFGKPTERKYTVKEVVNPPKTPYQVLWDSQIGHDLYRKTHNDYNPGEQAQRCYSKPFNPNQRFGKQSGYDPRGVWVKCATQWINQNPICTVYNLQADSKEHRQQQLGKVLAPNKNIESVPKQHTFGCPTKRPYYGMPDLLKDPDCTPCIEKRDFQDWMAILNQLRVYLKRRFNTFGFTFKDFYDRNLYYDKENSGWQPLNIFYDICKCYNVKYKHEALEPLFRNLGVMEGDKINYKSFIYLADINTSLPLLIKFKDLPERIKQYYISSSQSANCDFLSIDNSGMSVAGLPAHRHDQLIPYKPEGGCLADLENLGETTEAGALINPSIYTNYGLNYRDFYLPRKPEIIKQIFEKIGYEFPEDAFQKLWKIGLEIDKTGLVCVETFKNLIKETLPAHELIVENGMEC